MVSLIEIFINFVTMKYLKYNEIFKKSIDMRKIGLLLVLVGLSMSTFAQREIRRLNVGDSTKIEVDSTYTVNGELKGVYFKVFDYTPRLVSSTYIARDEVANVIKQLDLELRYQIYVVRQKRQFISDSLKQSDNLISEREMIQGDADVTRLKNELRVWKKIQKKFDKVE